MLQEAAPAQYTMQAGAEAGKQTDSERGPNVAAYATCSRGMRDMTSSRHDANWRHST